MLFSIVFFFFFSSRRRHTRFDCDWSSDVCSSDLFPAKEPAFWETLAARQARLGRNLSVSYQHALKIVRSEEHTSELQSQSNLVCRLLLEKKKNNNLEHTSDHTDIRQQCD